MEKKSKKQLELDKQQCADCIHGIDESGQSKDCEYKPSALKEGGLCRLKAATKRRLNETAPVSEAPFEARH